MCTPWLRVLQGGGSAHASVGAPLLVVLECFRDGIEELGDPLSARLSALSMALERRDRARASGWTPSRSARASRRAESSSSRGRLWRLLISGRWGSGQGLLRSMRQGLAVVNCFGHCRDACPRDGKGWWFKGGIALLRSAPEPTGSVRRVRVSRGPGEDGLCPRSPADAVAPQALSFLPPDGILDGGTSASPSAHPTTLVPLLFRDKTHHERASRPW